VLTVSSSEDEILEIGNVPGEIQLLSIPRAARNEIEVLTIHSGNGRKKGIKRKPVEEVEERPLSPSSVSTCMPSDSEEELRNLDKKARRDTVDEQKEEEESTPADASADTNPNPLTASSTIEQNNIEIPIEDADSEMVTEPMDTQLLPPLTVVVSESSPSTSGSGTESQSLLTPRIPQELAVTPTTSRNSAISVPALAPVVLRGRREIRRVIEAVTKEGEDEVKIATIVKIESQRVS